MPFSIVLGDITKMNTDAIVNAANTSLAKGGGVCGAIFAAADDERLADECRAIGYCETGKAVYTKGYNLKAKYIIHACGPIYDENDKKGSEDLLRNAYVNSLFLAKQLQVESISFPLISSGIYGYPKNEALKIAVEEIASFIKKEEMTIYLVLFDKNEYITDSSHIHRVDTFIKMTLKKEKPRPFTIRYREESTFTQDYRFRIENIEVRPRLMAEASICLDDYMNHLEETFSEMLLRLIKEKNKSHTDIYKKANIDRRLFSKIKNDKEYAPKKQTAIAFAIALELSLEETRNLLSKAGYALNMSSKFDVIIVYFLNKEFYNIFEINEILFAYDQPLLGV